uniref:Pectinesterase inhibitor domain-containing protein n=1 Tax=Oryza glumipatula TaxID=40148 RepID=A0A0E0BM50_9ORYZ
MSPRIPTRANLALAALLILLTVAATTVPLASAKCIAKNKPEGEEGEPGGAGAGAVHASPEKKPGSTGGLTTLSVGESVPEIKKDSSDDGAAVNESKKPKTSGGLTTLSVDDSQAEPADSIAEPVEDGTDDGEDEQEEKKKKKKKSKSKSSDDDDDDDAKKKSKKKPKTKPKNSDDDEDDKKKSKKKPKNPDDDEDDKKKSKSKSSDEDNDGAKKKKKKKSKGKSSDEEDDEKPKKKSKSKSKSSSSDEEDEKKSKSESQAAAEKSAAKPKEEDEEGGSASASASTSAPKNEHHSGTMSLPDPDMIAQPVMQALNPVVKALCGKTDHADLCESSIGQLPQQPPAQLDDIGVLRLSMNALRAKVQEAISVATNRMGAASGDEVSKDAMDDCLQMYDDMKSNLDSADAALKKGDKDTAHTMLDSARTDVDTCEDGFSEREGLKPIMGDLDKILAELSSNTIAIASAIIE